MCYGVKARTEMSLRIAKSRGDQEAVAKLTKLLSPFPELFDTGAEAVSLHYANAFTHPKLVVYTDAAPRDPQLALWGLVPAWVKDNTQRAQLWNQTLNARGESIFEKPAFRTSARNKRCIVHVEGFYEHHHFGKKTYPYFISVKGRAQFALAGLWEEWTDMETRERMRTFSIVTTEGNDLLKRIHNKPGSGPGGQPSGPRMPVILTEVEEDQWLAPIHTAADEETIRALIRPFPAEAMTAHTVAPLLGKDGKGNSEEASEPFDYPELLLADPLA